MIKRKALYYWIAALALGFTCARYPRQAGAGGDRTDIEKRTKPNLSQLPGDLDPSQLADAPSNQCLCGAAIAGPNAAPTYRPLSLNDIPPGSPPGPHGATHETGGIDQLGVNAPTAANRVYASPASGGAGAPVYRALVYADLPPAPLNQVLAGPTSGGAAPPVYRPLEPADIAPAGQNQVLAGPTAPMSAAPTYRVLQSTDIAVALASPSTVIDPINISPGTVNSTEFGYLDGLGASIVSLLAGKAPATGIDPLNILPGTISSTELGYLDGLGASLVSLLAAKAPSTNIDPLNIQPGTISSTELGYLDGLGASLVSLLAGKAPATNIDPLNIQPGTIDSTELGYLNGLGSAAVGTSDARLCPVSSGGRIYYDNGTACTALANGTAGYLLKSNGTTVAPSYLDKVPIANGGTNSTTGDLIATNNITSPLFQSTGTATLNGVSGSIIQHNGVSYLITSATALTLGNAPLIRTPRTVTGNVTLNAYDNVVYLNYTGATSMTVTLPSAPPDGTPIQFTGTGTSTSSSGTTIQRGGSDTIVTSVVQSLHMDLQGQSATFVYDAARTRWWINGLQAKRLHYKWTSAAANDYLQPAVAAVVALGTYPITYPGGAVGTADPIYPTSGLVITSGLSLFTRTAPAGNQTVKVRTVTQAFASPADLSTNLQANINGGGGGTSGFASQVINLISNGPFGGGFLVFQATTTITVEMDIYLDIFTL